MYFEQNEGPFALIINTRILLSSLIKFISSLIEDNNLNESALWALGLFKIKLQIPLLSSRIKIFSLRTILIFQSIKIYLNIFRKYQYYYDCGMRNANDIVISSPKKCRLIKRRHFILN